MSGAVRCWESVEPSRIPNIPPPVVRETQAAQISSRAYSHVPVEGLYCKRPIQCLASCKILTPHPSHRPPLVQGADTLAKGRGSLVIVWKTPDTALYSIICQYFVHVPHHRFSLRMLPRFFMNYELGES